MKTDEMVTEITSRSALYARLDDRDQAVIRSWIRMAHMDGQRYAEAKAAVGDE